MPQKIVITGGEVLVEAELNDSATGKGKQNIRLSGD